MPGERLDLALHPESLVDVIEEIFLERIRIVSTEKDTDSTQQRRGVVAFDDQMSAGPQDTHASLENQAGVKHVDRTETIDGIDRCRREDCRRVVFPQIRFEDVLD